MRTMRLRCPSCERNLADVEHYETNPAWTKDGLAVLARPGVKQVEYRPWPGDRNASPYDRTYTWYCYCGATIVKRHQRISELWQQHADKPGRLVTVVLKDGE